MGSKKIGVLIGGSGLIGGTIVNFYKNRYAESVDIRAPSSKKLSIREESDIRRYLTEIRPDFVINAAMASLAADGQLSFEVNYKGPVNLARAATALKIPYIHISSAATLPTGENLREDDTLPITPNLSNYAKSKLMAETTLRLMAEKEGLSPAVLFYRRRIDAGAVHQEEHPAFVQQCAETAVLHPSHAAKPGRIPQQDLPFRR
jgi:dTDP-4-dehydrorhamnose reductase